MTERLRPFWSKTAAGVTATPVVIYLPERAKQISIVVTERSLVATGGAYTAPSVGDTNGIITIATAGTPTGGTFKLTAWPGQGSAVETSALTFDESAADIKTALIATGFFASGDITAAGGALPTAVTLTFTAVYAGTTPLLIPSSVALTGGTDSQVTAGVTTLPIGNGGYAYLQAGETNWFTLSDNRVSASRPNRYLYLASDGVTSDYFLTAYE